MAFKRTPGGWLMRWLTRFFVVPLILSVAGPLFGQQSDYAALRPPRPETPSVPGLEEIKQPKLVPGLELINPGYAPTLTADMKTLVFSSSSGSNDLYITQRDSVEKPFGQPARIAGCSSRQDDTFPSISPDGLELLFVRFGPQPKLYYSRRDSTKAEFETAVPWPVAEALPQGRYPGGPQFIDQKNVQFVTRGATANRDRAIMLTTRDAPEAKFGEPSVFMNLKGPNPYWLSADRLRAYYGVPNGLYFAALKPESDAFSNPAKIADVPIDGPVWLSPKEDVLFFCSPDQGKAVDESNRRLWMLRL